MSSSRRSILVGDDAHIVPCMRIIGATIAHSYNCVEHCITLPSVVCIPNYILISLRQMHISRTGSFSKGAVAAGD